MDAFTITQPLPGVFHIQVTVGYGRRIMMPPCIPPMYVISCMLIDQYIHFYNFERI